MIDGLTALGIETLVQDAAASIDGAYAQIEELGELTGHADGAAELVADMQGDFDALLSETPSGDGLTYYHELDATLFSLTSATFAGEIYALFGFENVADAADADGVGYPSSPRNTSSTPIPTSSSWPTRSVAVKTPAPCRPAGVGRPAGRAGRKRG